MTPLHSTTIPAEDVQAVQRDLGDRVWMVYKGRAAAEVRAAKEQAYIDANGEDARLEVKQHESTGLYAVLWFNHTTPEAKEAPVKQNLATLTAATSTPQQPVQIVITDDEGSTETSEPRYWINDVVDFFPYGDDTVGIVDEEAGGVILYVHTANAVRVLDALVASV